MQNKKIKQEFVLLAVPAELILAAGIFGNGLVQMYAEGNKLVIENQEDLSDFVCDGNCKSCPMSEMDCDGECSACPCRGGCEDAEVD